MYDVAVRDIPEGSLLCLQRAATDQAEVFALGKEFIAILREHKLPQLDGPGGEVFLIYHGEVSADSDGPVEMCRPVPAGQLAAAVPALTLRTEPAHREAYVHLGNATMTGPQWELLTQSMQDWAAGQQQEPGDLGVRITFRHLGPGAAASVPDTDFAVPLRDSGDRRGRKDIRVSRRPRRPPPRADMRRRHVVREVPVCGVVAQGMRWLAHADDGRSGYSQSVSRRAGRLRNPRP